MIYNYQVIWLSFILFFISPIYGVENKLIVVMGASCSGKSMLSKNLLQHLGSEWKFVGLDEIEDQYKAEKKIITNDELIDAVRHQANKYLVDGCSVLIDTNMYDDSFAKIHCDCKMFVWVYCPLSVLLTRNAERDMVLQRSGNDARHAQEYVMTTFNNFENHQCYDVKIDSSAMSLDESLEKIIVLIS